MKPAIHDGKATPRIILAAALAISVTGCANGVGFNEGIGNPSGPDGPSGPDSPTGVEGPIASINLGGETITGPSGDSTLVGVNLLPTSEVEGTLATIDILTGDGTVVEVDVPTTATDVERTHSPLWPSLRRPRCASFHQFVQTFRFRWLHGSGTRKVGLAATRFPSRPTRMRIRVSSSIPAHPDKN